MKQHSQSQLLSCWILSLISCWFLAICEIFEKADLSGDGNISIFQYFKVFNIFKYFPSFQYFLIFSNIPISALCEIFEKADLSGDGSISIFEYIAVCDTWVFSSFQYFNISILEYIAVCDTWVFLYSDVIHWIWKLFLHTENCKFHDFAHTSSDDLWKGTGLNLKRRTLSKLGQLLIMKGRWGLWDFPEEKTFASDSQEWLHQAHQAVEPDDRVQADRPRERPSLAKDYWPRIQVLPTLKPFQTVLLCE